MDAVKDDTWGSAPDTKRRGHIDLTSPYPLCPPRAQGRVRLLRCQGGASVAVRYYLGVGTVTEERRTWKSQITVFIAKVNLKNVE